MTRGQGVGDLLYPLDPLPATTTFDMVIGAIFLVLTYSLGLAGSVPTKRWSSTVCMRSVIPEAPLTHMRMCGG